MLATRKVTREKKGILKPNFSGHLYFNKSKLKWET